MHKIVSFSASNSLNRNIWKQYTTALAQQNVSEWKGKSRQGWRWLCEWPACCANPRSYTGSQHYVRARPRSAACNPCPAEWRLDAPRVSVARQPNWNCKLWVQWEPASKTWWRDWEDWALTSVNILYTRTLTQEGQERKLAVIKWGSEREHPGSRAQTEAQSLCTSLIISSALYP